MTFLPGRFETTTRSPESAGGKEVRMYLNYASVLAYALFGAAFVILCVTVLSRLLRPRVRDATKDETYECGEPPIGSAWVRFDMRFYTVALIFIIFEVEVVFLFPWAVVFQPLLGVFIFLEAFIFLAILSVGLVYVWRKGDLDWVKGALSQQPQPRREALPETGADAKESVGVEV
jgi:NADH-quinone oxidoreductase subunit A